MHLPRPVLSGVAVVIALGLFAALLPSEGRTELFAEAHASNPDALHPTYTFSVGANIRTLPAAFAEAGLEYHPEDQVTQIPGVDLGMGSVITVTQALPVTIVDGKKVYVTRTWAETVSQLVEEKKIELGAEDRISPSLQTVLGKGSKVTVTRVARTNVTEKKAIPFETKVEKDYHQFVGAKTTLEAGKNGELEEVYLLIREDGELVSKTLISKSTTLQPKTAVIREGALNPVSSRCAQYKDWVVDASLKNKIDPNGLFYRMGRESNCNPTSQASAGYQGLLQYDPGLWPSLSAKAGFAGASIWDAKSQIYVTAWAWANGHRSRWPNP